MAVLGPHEGQSPAKDTLLLAQDVSYAKHLAANDEKERRKALKYLHKYLDQRSKAGGKLGAKGGAALSEESLQVLWKGLFFAMWMSDLPLVQEDCAESIAHLLHALPLPEALRFFRAGLTMLQNEWLGIDQLRLNKFLMVSGFPHSRPFSFNLPTAAGKAAAAPGAGRPPGQQLPQTRQRALRCRP